MKLLFSFLPFALFGTITKWAIAIELDEQFPPLALRSDIPKLGGHQFSLEKALSKHAVNGEDFECPDETKLDMFAAEYLVNLSQEDKATLKWLLKSQRIDLWIAYAAIVFPENRGTDFFYPSAQQGRLYERLLGDMENFWGMFGSSVSVHPLTTDVLRDTDLMVEVVLSIAEGVTKEMAEMIVTTVQQTLSHFPSIGYDYPLYTLNAFAYGNGVIAMGDGIIRFSEWADLEDGGPRIVLFHEYGHQIQFSMGVFDNLEPSAETTRYVELMADALAAYYAYHPKGDTLRAFKIEQSIETMYAAGDCRFNSRGHHGTPNQRAKSVRFAIDLIDNSSKKGHILTSAEFINLFMEEYDNIIAPDARA